MDVHHICIVSFSKYNFVGENCACFAKHWPYSNSIDQTAMGQALNTNNYSTTQIVGFYTQKLLDGFVWK